MKCPYCQAEFEHAIATQIVHIDVLVDENGEFYGNVHEDIIDGAYFEDPVGDYACPVCGEYVANLNDFINCYQ